MITCTFENGNTTSLRHVVVDVLVIKDGNILLVRRASHLLEGGKLALVGGFVDRDETTEQAALREIKEETGYIAKIEKLLRFKDNPNRRNEDRQNISFVYVATVLEKVAEHDHEVTEVTWFPLNNLPSQNEIAFDHYDDIQFYLSL